MQYQNSKSCEENYSTYFPYFNHTLFIEEENFCTENDLPIKSLESQVSDISSTNTSQTSINSLEDEEKLIPLNLLDLSPVKSPSNDNDKFDVTPENFLGLFKEEEEKNNEKIKPELQKFILPKSLFNNTKFKKKDDNDQLDEKKLKVKPFIPTKYRIDNASMINCPAENFNLENKKSNKFDNYIEYELKLKCKRKKFVERKGDWRCSKCKNINFSFRDKCNKCKITKEESQKYLCILDEIL